MKLEEIKKDVELIKEYNDKHQKLTEKLRGTPKGNNFSEFQKELQKQPWAEDYGKIVSKYIPLFYANNVYADDYECSPIGDFLKITVALMEAEL